jgi:hypothetical protein
MFGKNDFGAKTKFFSKKFKSLIYIGFPKEFPPFRYTILPIFL